MIVRKTMVVSKAVMGMAAIFSVTAMLMATSAFAEEKHPFKVKAEYVEGCSCSAPCACQLTGVEPGCQGVNAVHFLGGEYMGVNLAGAKFAFATIPGKWVRVYVDAKNPKQREATAALARAYTGPFGKVESVKDAKVTIEGKDGKYTLKVDGGKIMALVTEPVLGGDNKTPLVYSNIHDALHTTVKQGKTVSGSYHDGDDSFELKDSNAYFNEKFEQKGEI